MKDRLAGAADEDHAGELVRSGEPAQLTVHRRDHRRLVGAGEVVERDRRIAEPYAATHRQRTGSFWIRFT